MRARIVRCAAALLWLGACSDGGGLDGGADAASPDAAARDAAALAADAAGAIDAVIAEADAEPADEDAAVRPDALPADAAASSTVGVARAELCARLHAALTAYFARCHPALSAREAALVAERHGCGDPRTHLAESHPRYDGAIAAACLDDVAALGCAGTALPASCLDVQRAPDFGGDGCAGGCGAASVCMYGNKEAPSPPQPLQCQPRACGLAPCGRGHYCDGARAACLPLPGEGEPCALTVPCGEAFGLEPRVCVFTASSAVGRCVAPAAPGEACGAERPCDRFTACIQGRCALRPTEGERCEATLAIAPPERGQSGAAFVAARAAAEAACRVPGLFCRSSTAGAGRCAVDGALGERCGLGPGLSPRCRQGYCAALQPGGALPVEGRCAPGRDVTPCDDWREPVGLETSCTAQRRCVLVAEPECLAYPY